MLRPSKPEQPDFRIGPGLQWFLSPALWPSDYKSSTSFWVKLSVALCSLYLSPISLLIQAPNSSLEGDIWKKALEYPPKSYCSWKLSSVFQFQCFMPTTKSATHLKSFLSTFENGKVLFLQRLELRNTGLKSTICQNMYQGWWFSYITSCKYHKTSNYFYYLYRKLSRISKGIVSAKPYCLLSEMW